MADTSIEWTDLTPNPFRARNLETGNIGHYCQKISPGCLYCYAARWQHRLGTDLDFLPRNREKVELFLDEKVLRQVLKRRKPSKCFWCDMTDMFYEGYPFEWIDKCFDVMALTPQHVHQILTKRPERMLEYLKSRCHGEMKNVWLGTSVEDQKRADERIPILRHRPALIRFLSVEPILEPVNLDLEGIDWVIFGGESGMHLFNQKTREQRGNVVTYSNGKWFATEHGLSIARSVRNQCIQAGVKFFLKQFGGAYPKSAGRVLDLHTWDEMPGEREMEGKDTAVLRLPVLP
ncbi:MAG: phage Gp37/Gp68 family protein [Planctomycetes bacterium]|nr:phage Gp37/Gp68 family protein [Planctomycetota bacterium]